MVCLVMSSLIGSASPSDATEAEHLFILMLQASRRRDRNLSGVLRPLGLTVSKWRVLRVLQRLPGCAMGELAEFSTIERTTLTRTVDQLVRAGLVDRRQALDDRRQVLMALTAAGAHLAETVYPVVRAYNGEAMAGADGQALAAAVAVMERAVRNLAESEEETEHIIGFSRPAASSAGARVPTFPSPRTGRP